MRYSNLVLSSVFLLAASANATTISATNNPLGKFEDGTFRLPSHTNPNDKYIITIKIEGEKEKAWTLPPGAKGLILGDEAIPVKPWTWSFLLQQGAPPKVEFITSNNPIISRTDIALYDDSTLLEWVPVTGTQKYKVTTSTLIKGTNEWSDDANYECFANECHNIEKNKVHYAFKPESDKHYRWKVSAIDANKIVIAQSEYQYFDIPKTLFEETHNAGWSLQRSDTLTATDIDKPALFGYNANQKNGSERSSSYSAIFALIWTGNTPIYDGIFPRFSVETKRNSSGDAKAGDATRLRFGVSSSPVGYNWTGSLKYETERKTGTEKGMAEFNVTPVLGWLARYNNFPQISNSEIDSAGNIPINRRPIIQVMPVISFGADIGRTFAVGTSKETGDTVARLRSDLRVNMLWSRLGAILGVPKFSTYAEGTYWKLRGNDSHHLTKAGISIGFTKELSFDIAYSVGEDAPDFTFARSTNVGLGIKF